MTDNKTIFVIKGPKALIDIQHNERFIFTETHIAEDDYDAASPQAQSVSGDHGTPAPNRSRPLVLRATTDHLPKDTHAGFVIGRNPAKCDIVLNDDRVSDTHLHLKLNLAGRTLVVKNVSRHGTVVNFSLDSHTRMLKSTQVLMNLETVDVQIADDLSFRIQHPQDPVDWVLYCKLYPDRTNGLSLGHLGLSSQPETSNASQRPPVYMRDHRLGQGAFGEVFRAVDRRTGDVYAMKLFSKPEKARWQEPAMLQRLDHEHIVRYVAYSHMSGQSAQLIMEYVEGPNLQTFLDPRNNHAPLRLSEAREVLRQLLQALDYLHGQNITHRDVKPANIVLVSRDPIYTKLVDFGFATDASSFQTHCGTPLYLAPELLTKRGRWSNKVDIFAIGVVALALLGIAVDLTRATGPRDCLRAVLHQRHLLVASNQPPPEQYDFVIQLLAERPDDRPSARACLNHAFFQLADEDLSVEDAGQTQDGYVPDLRTRIFHPSHRGPAYDTAELATEIADTPAGFLCAETASVPGVSVARQDTRQLSSSSLSERRLRQKRQKQAHTATSSGRRTRSDRSPAPSPPSSEPSYAVQASIASVLEDGVDQASSGYNEYASTSHTGSDLPDTASYDSGSRHSHHSPEEQTGNNEDQVEDEDEEGSESGFDSVCWMDPMHVLGGGSSLARDHGENDPVYTFASQKLVSDTTPNFSSLGGFGSEHSTGGRDGDVFHAAQGDEVEEGEEEEVEDDEDEDEDDLNDNDDDDDDDDEDINDDDTDDNDNTNDDDYDGNNPGEQGVEQGDEDDTEGVPPNGETRAASSTPVRRRKRTLPRYKELLEAEYQQNPRPSKTDYLRILETVSMNAKQLQVWFQNRRQRDRRASGPGVVSYAVMSPRQMAG